MKQINRRIKGTEKLWDLAKEDAILQLRADYLSETEPMAKFWERRRQQGVGQRCNRRAAQRISRSAPRSGVRAAC